MIFQGLMHMAKLCHAWRSHQCNVADLGWAEFPLAPRAEMVLEARHGMGAHAPNQRVLAMITYTESLQ
jgi:hypothetical protein